MPKETDFYTATMAKVYVDQGHWAKAAEIYRHLLKQQPDREDYLSALARAQRNAAQADPKAIEDLASLFQQWFDLMLKYKNLQKLRKLKG